MTKEHQAVKAYTLITGASAGLGIAGAGLTSLTGSRAAMANITMSCGLIVISLIFLGLCMLVGALAATLLLVGTG